jgi:hypothetical protein
MAWQAICGKARSPLCELGWKSLGVLELTALPSISEKVWVPMVEETDALLVWGGDPLYLSHWMRQSGLAGLLPSLRQESLYVGVSAGSMAVASIFGETYRNAPSGTGSALTSEDIRFTTPQGEIRMTFITAKGAGLVDFALIPHPGSNERRLASDCRRDRVLLLPGCVRARTHLVSGPAFAYDVERHKVDGVSVRIYSPAKTVADCFRFRNKIGVDVAIEALREALRAKRCTREELWAASKACRVTTVIRPYLEAI